MEREPPRLFAKLAIVAALYHAGAMLLLHVLVPAVDPLEEMVSAYLVSDYALLSRSTFLALAAVWVFLGVALYRRGLSGIAAILGFGLAVVATLGFVGVASAPSMAQYFAIPTQPATVLAILTFSLALRRADGFQQVSAVLLAISGALVTLFVLTIASGLLIAAGLGGAANRVVLLLIYSWVLLVASRLIGVRGSTGS